MGPGELGEGPVEMLKLPTRLVIQSLDQYRPRYKAIADSTLGRILGILQNGPTTAKQSAVRPKTAPGTAVYHLRVLEKAGLVKVVTLRKVRDISAKYDTRTAWIFAHELPTRAHGARGGPGREHSAPARAQQG